MVTYNPCVNAELIFKALADRSRRKLLDLLYLNDGQSLKQLEKRLDMTRFGVMKHLRVLHDAGLVVTEKKGREKLHFLNAVPIQMVYDRWVSKFSKGWAGSLTELKYDLESNEMEATMSRSTDKVFEIYIETSAEKLWQALTSPDFTEKYYFGTRLRTDLSAGSEFDYLMPDGSVMLEGKVVESEEQKRLVTTFIPRWAGDAAAKESRVVYEIEQMDSVCRLRLTHIGLADGDPMTEGISNGWSKVLSGLKTLLETGKILPVFPE